MESLSPINCSTVSFLYSLGQWITEVKLQKAAFFPVVELVDLTQINAVLFTTALLMRWQVIPANFVVFCNDLIFIIPRDQKFYNNNNNNELDEDGVSLLWCRI